MGTLKLLLWTVVAVGVGIYLATGEVSGKTPLEHGQRAVSVHVSGERIDGLKEDLAFAHQRLREKVEGGPVERYSPKERQAVDALIAGGAEAR